MADKPTYEKLLKRIEELEESERSYRTIADNSPDLLYRTDLEGRITYISRSAYDLSGYTMEESIGLSMAQEVYLYPAERDQFLEELQKRGKVTNFEARLKRKDGSIWWASTNATFCKDIKGNITGVEGITRDVSEIKAAEEALKESEKKYRLLFDYAPAGIFEVDLTEERFKNVNELMCRYSGYTKTEFLSLNPYLLIRENPNVFFSDEILEKTIECRLTRKNGENLLVTMNIDYIIKNEERVGARAVVQDITERKKMEALLVHSEKMVTIAGLAAGMAHEINNPLAGMMQNAQVVLNRISPELPANRNAAEEAGITLDALQAYMDKRDIINSLEHINTSGRRAAEIVKNMLGFVRKSSSQKQYEDPVEIMNAAWELTWNDWDLAHAYDIKKIRIIREYQPELPKVYCEKSKIQQVLFNIIKNASEALNEDKNSGDSCLTFRIQKNGNMVRIEIEDNGPGMNHETLHRIFEPFYTTKSGNRGTGLGLAVSYFIIVDDHKGKLDVESSPGSGCIFKILLPIEAQSENT